MVMPKLIFGALLFALMTTSVITTDAQTASSNPLLAPSTLPYQTIPFDKIKDDDYQPAIDQGMAEQLKEVDAIANNPAPPTFDNTLVALEKSGQALRRATSAFFAQAGANTNPTLLKVRSIEAPKLAAHRDAIFLNTKLFHRVSAVYQQRDSLKLDPESKRLLEWYYNEFVHAGANLSEADKTPAAEKAKERKVEGYLIPLQNTTQQPELATLTNRTTRETIFNNSWNRAERGDDNDTRDTISKIAQLRAQKAKLLGFPNFAAWKLEDQMAKNPENALKFLNSIAPPATARAASEAKDIQSLIDQQKGGFQVQPWDWDLYSEQVRKAKYDLDEEQVKPYFEINNVLENGVFYAATQLYGITFKERKDLPVYDSDMRVFEVFNADGSSLALFYTDYFKRDNKQGGAWMNNFVEQSKLMGTKPVVVNVANFAKPAAGEPALLTSDDVRTMFHEFGHALHGMFANTTYPAISGTSTARDFVEFPSQFNEYWAEYPTV